MILDFIFSFLCTFGFGVLFNIPRKQLVLASTGGAVGWTVYSLFLLQFDSIVMAAFTGALAVGMVSEIMAKLRRVPATVYVVPGIIPLVPGYGLYYSMKKIIESDYIEAMEVGTETVLVALAISSAVILTTSIGRKIHGSRRGNMN
ncbi:Uncharacterized membrane protein YjjB, DUF3815 family [Dethiosulfatibacter aminovorans DSM 17477]|uniref:Uncharacterized membrane protein YjjB, DUF3815 family n=1 Tax=Dethiosulfatibacter aminovorans DSM 17477 TaxID=1121476 RepID=A0A1M6BTY5_9FIRM|nr:threonine/serine exporter family protein [Dethiosulfatibacter aminovorans]SHI52252.1 Uncharacterized membrane protein YjjB, DUF3815 family [Dethiosulfatibacter aminovorans DSM 17477]